MVDQRIPVFHQGFRNPASSEEVDLQKRKTFAVIPPNRVVEVANSRRWVV